MEARDRQAIEGLFSRLDTVDRNSPPRDAEADALIRERVSASPNAPYLMAQTIVMQDYALTQAQQRIEELEREAAERPAPGGGGFLSSLFGGGSQPARPQATPGRPMGAPGGSPMGAAPGAPAGSPWRNAAANQQPARGGGFLAGAAQTAMGVAGGVLISNAIGSMFSGGDEAKAAEAPAAAPEQAAAAEQPTQTAEAQPAPDEGGGIFDSFFGGGDEDVA
jgi:hypothetical protein